MTTKKKTESSRKRNAADVVFDDTSSKASPLKQQKLGRYRPPILWEVPSSLDNEDYPDSVEYEYTEYGMKEKVRVELFDGSTRTEGAVRLLKKIDEYTDRVLASVEDDEEVPNAEQIKLKKLKQWTIPPAREHVMRILTENFTITSDDDEVTRTIAEWMQNGDDEEKTLAWKEARSRFICQYSGEKPFDREREYIMASLPWITLDAVEQDLRDWFRRLETLSDYLHTLHEAQYPFMDDDNRGQITLSSREKREIWLRNVDIRINQYVKGKEVDIYDADIQDFQSWMEQGLLTAQLERENSRRLQKQIEGTLSKAKKNGYSIQKDKRNDSFKNRNNVKKHCGHCEKLGKPRHVIKSHNENTCRFKNRDTSGGNETRKGVHNLNKCKGKAKRKGRGKKGRNDDESSVSSNDSTSSDDSDYSETLESRKRKSVNAISIPRLPKNKRKEQPYKNHWMAPENPAKRVKKSHWKNPKPEVIVRMKPKDKDVLPHDRTIRALLDSGSDGTIIIQKYAGKRFAKKRYKSVPQVWNTRGGAYSTSQKADISFILPEFATQRTINAKVFVDTTTDPKDVDYDMIIGGDLMRELGIDVCYSSLTVRWDEFEVPMKEANALSNKKTLHNTYMEALEPKSTAEATKRVVKILDARYEKANLDSVVEEATYLTPKQRSKLLILLKDFEDLFDGTLGKWDTAPVDFELLPDAKPYHGKAFPVPRIHHKTLKKELDRLCGIKAIRKIPDNDDSREWAAPTFIIPKKNGTVRFVSDFRKLNKWIKRSPYPIPVIRDIMLQLEGFTYATSLDLNMGYYTLRLTPNASRLCTIITPFGKYEYLALPMGVSVSPDIFQHRMSSLMDGLTFVRTYLDDLLTITKGSFDDHLQKLHIVLERLRNAGLKINAEKSFFARSELEYLGYWVTREGIQPMPKKVKAILNIESPTNRKQLRRFIGMVNFYRDMWIHRSHIMAPLTKMTSSKVKYQWEEKHQQAFDLIKKVIAREVLLTYPDFSKEFEIHTDASKLQLGAVIMQDGKPLAFYSRKLSPAQTRYTTTERELLSIVETLKEYKSILLGSPIKLVIKTDHKNLTYTNQNTDRVLRWRLLIEEFGPEIQYIKGEKNVIADALSRFNIKEDDDAPTATAEANAHLFSMSKSEYLFPLLPAVIKESQKTDKELQRLRTNQPHAYPEEEVDDVALVHYKGKMYVPKALRKDILEWYHTYLVHPGITRTKETIRQHMTWPGLSNDVEKYVKTCSICQKNKRQKKKYGKLPAKQAEVFPWKTVCVDLIGRYTIKTKDRKKVSLLAMTMIDPATGWLEIAILDDKKADTAARNFDQSWLCRYPRPKACIHDNGREFLGKEFEEMLLSAGIKPKPTTVRNPQANGVIERVHQVLGNMLRTFGMTQKSSKNIDWNQVLQPCAWAVRSTYHTTMEATPGQLVFGRDMIYDIKFKANWEYIRKRKQNIIDTSNKRENAGRIEHRYKPGHLVQLKNDSNKNLGHFADAYLGPYRIKKVHRDNGTVTLDRGGFDERVNIRRIIPYHSRE